MTFKEFYTEEFYKQAKKYRHFRSQIKNKIDLLVQDPYHNCKSELLLGNLKGFRSARATRSIRIVFAICDECRKRGWQKLTGCSSLMCQRLGNEAIVFFTIGTHEIVYED